MNILLIHLNPMGHVFHIGSAYLTSVLKDKKHNVSFLSLSALDANTISEEISNNKTDIILISLTSGSFQLCIKIIEFVNIKTNIPILLGGIHPTISPEECINLDGVLGLCVGEGEYPLCELLESMEKGRDYTKIKNLWIKKNGIIYKNELRPLIHDLDDLPFPDYSIFKNYQKFAVIPVILSRGCPFNCSYCCNNTLQRLYKGKGSYVRHHSVPYAMELIKHLLKDYSSARAIEFYDDTFTINKVWLYDFLKTFSSLNINFICNSRFDIIDEGLATLLRDTGCIRINAAVECGNEEIRKKVLGKYISNKMIAKKAAMIRKNKIHLHSHNMLGIPYEKKKDLIKTIELNKMINVDSVQVSIFNPFPKTELEKLCSEKKWINKDLKTASYRDFTTLQTPFIKPHIVNYYFLVFTSMIFDAGFSLYIKRMFCWILCLNNNRLYISLRHRWPKILAECGIRPIMSKEAQTNNQISIIRFLKRLLKKFMLTSWVRKARS